MLDIGLSSYLVVGCVSLFCNVCHPERSEACLLQAGI